MYKIKSTTVKISRYHKYIDTHCNIPNILKKMKLNSFTILQQNHFPENFESCVSVASDQESQADTYRLIQNEENLYGAFGIHPLYSSEYTKETKNNIENIYSKHEKTVAYGEIGLDFHDFAGQNYASPEEQEIAFREQTLFAVKLSKPIIIHTREAEEKTLEIMKELIPKDYFVHVHCFTDTQTFALNLMEYFSNLYIGFTGVITFPSANDIRDVVKVVPLEKLLLETDGPFMAPHKFRKNKKNRNAACHPGLIPEIAEKIAEIKNVSIEDLYRITTENAKKVYNI